MARINSVRAFFAGMSRSARKLAGDEAGSPAVEFALVFPIFIGVVLATLQAGSIFLAKAFFESGAEAAARVVLTNQTTGTMTAAQFKTEICNQLTALFNCGQVTVELEPVPAGTTTISAMLPTFDSEETSSAHRQSLSAPMPARPAPTCCSWSCIRGPSTAARSALTFQTWAMAKC